MAAKAKHTVYEEVCRYTRRHFGREGLEHIHKLIEIHLHKPPEELTGEDLISMLDWIKGTISFLAEDIEDVDRYIKVILNIANRTDLDVYGPRGDEDLTEGSE